MDDDEDAPQFTKLERQMPLRKNPEIIYTSKQVRDELMDRLQSRRIKGLTELV